MTNRLFAYDGHPTQAGKEVLIRAIAQSIPTYVMSVFKLPMELCNDLNRLIRNYYWGAEKGKRKTHWHAWHKITRPKKQGGLGFKDFCLFNQALLARQAWRILEFPDNLCARLLKAKYFESGVLAPRCICTHYRNTHFEKLKNSEQKSRVYIRTFYVRSQGFGEKRRFLWLV